MALPAKRIPESVAQLDIEVVAAALIRNDANVRDTARALGVPPGDLRKLVTPGARRARSRRVEARRRRGQFCAKGCVAMIRGGVTPFRCSCCAIRSAP